MILSLLVTVLLLGSAWSASPAIRPPPPVAAVVGPPQGPFGTEQTECMDSTGRRYPRNHVWQVAEKNERCTCMNVLWFAVKLQIICRYEGCKRTDGTGVKEGGTDIRNGSKCTCVPGRPTDWAADKPYPPRFHWKC